MKIAIIGTVGVPANYGGFETLVENLVTMKSSNDISYIVYCSSKSYKNKLKEYHGAKLKYIPFKANGWQSLIYDNISLLRAYFSADAILSLGGANLLHPFLRLFSRKLLINNFDGLDCDREKWNFIARKTLRFTTRITAKYADLCVSDNEIIQQYLKKKYNRESVLIEYGGDNASRIENDLALQEEFGLKKHEYCFKVARIEPENNIEMILQAFSEVPEEKLVIVGNWENSKFGKDLKVRFEDSPNIDIYDPIYASEKLNLLRSNCKWYIHGHSAGGTNPSLVEAMSLGLPIISYHVEFNKATTERCALYFSDCESLKELLKSNRDNVSVGNKMKSIADKRYKWDIICNKYESLYETLKDK